VSECLYHEDGDCIHHACTNCYAEIYGELLPLRAAATYALSVLTRLADSAYQWAGRDVPPGLVSEIDEAKARLAGVLS